MSKFFDDVAAALKPYGYEWPLSWTGIAGPGSQIVVFAGLGDFYAACLTHDCQVVWVMTCGGQELDSNTDECNALNQSARDFYRIGARGTPRCPDCQSTNVASNPARCLDCGFAP